MTRDRLYFLLLNMGHFLDHLLFRHDFSFTANASLLGGYLASLGLRLSLSDLRIALHLGVSLATDRLEISRFVREVLDLKEVQHDPQSRELLARTLRDLLCQLESAFIRLLGSHASDDAAQSPFEHLLSGLVHGVGAFPQESLDSGLQPILDATGKLDVGPTLDIHGDHALAKRLVWPHFDGPPRQRQSCR